MMSGMADSCLIVGYVFDRDEGDGGLDGDRVPSPAALEITRG